MKASTLSAKSSAAMIENGGEKGTAFGFAVIVDGGEC